MNGAGFCASWLQQLVRPSFSLSSKSQISTILQPGLTRKGHVVNTYRRKQTRTHAHTHTHTHTHTRTHTYAHDTQTHVYSQSRSNEDMQLIIRLCLGGLYEHDFCNTKSIFLTLDQWLTWAFPCTTASPRLREWSSWNRECATRDWAVISLSRFLTQLQRIKQFISRWKKTSIILTTFSLTTWPLVVRPLTPNQPAYLHQTDPH